MTKFQEALNISDVLLLKMIWNLTTKPNKFATNLMSVNYCKFLLPQSRIKYAVKLLKRVHAIGLEMAKVFGFGRTHGYHVTQSDTFYHCLQPIYKLR